MTSTVPDAGRPSAIRTFLIADIRGWTRFTRELGDEAASRLAAKFAQIVGEAVEAWGGQLLELRGDEAMCTFESARGALRCAVELQEAFADEIALAPELPLRVGIGLDAGEAVAVGDGYRGSALNVAARLCSAAAAGEVIATASLVHLAGRVDGLTFAELDAKPMKGFDQPVPAVLVDSVAPHEHDRAAEAASPVSPPPLPAELDAIVPLVGREADLRWLAWHWRRACHGHGGVVVISGVQGIGRTRLAAELASLAHRDGAAVAYGPSGNGDLLVVDDVDELSAQHSAELDHTVNEDAGRRLVVLTTEDPHLDRLTRRIAAVRPEERHRRLGPVDLAAVAAIGRLYLDDPDVDVPAHLLHEESRGIPSAVHRVASQWAGAAARRRLGESARRTSRERRDLRAAEAAMIDDVERLELTRERTRLYVPELESESASNAAMTRSVCPYKGLAAFEGSDAEYYFGRERLVAELIARMVGSSFVALIGASGSGKSSALQAGVLPALATGVIPGSEAWIQVQMRPGEKPMLELQQALHRSLPHRPAENAPPGGSLDAALADAAPAQRLLLVVDQFEELFSSTVEEGERARFIELLTAQRPRTKVLVALRADHYERCAAYPRLARLIGAEQVLVGPLAAAEIAGIIRHPAERAGLRVEHDLVEALVADIGTEPGGLPLLSTALLELWEAREDDRLTLSAYRATGGVRGAVARLAESVYRRLDPEEQAEARSLLLRLAGETDERVVVRRRVPLDEFRINEDPQSDAVFAALTEGRLLTASEGYVEVAHEALLREWPRLRSWIEEDSSGRQLRLHLMSAARAWDEGSREEGDLYRGARLAAALEWAEAHGHELNAVERAFVEESRTASQRETARQRRTNQRLRAMLVGTAVFLIVAIGAGALAYIQGREARARELYASAISVVERDPELSLRLYLAGLGTGVEPHDDAVSALHRALMSSRAVRSFRLDSDGARPSNIGVGISPDGTTVYATADSRSIRSFDVESGVEGASLGEPATDRSAPFLGPAVSPDGRRVAQVDEDGVVHVWDLADGGEWQAQARGVGADWSVFSPDGAQLATITREPDQSKSYISLFDVQTQRQLGEWEAEDIYAVGFDLENDRLLATACPCNLRDVVLWLDIRSGGVTNPFADRQGPGPESTPTAAQFSPDGRVLATAGIEGTVRLWDTETLELVETFIGHARDVTYIGFSNDGSLLATTSTDGTVRVWNVAEGSLYLTLQTRSGIPGFAAFSEDRRRLVTASSDLSVTIWDISLTRGEVGGMDLGEAVSRVWDFELRSDRVLVNGWSCTVGSCPPGTVRSYDLMTGTVEREFSERSGIGVALLDDGAVVTQVAFEREEDGETRWVGGELQLWPAGDEPPIVLDGLCTAADMINVAECEDAARAPWLDEPAGLEASADGEVIVMAGYEALATWDRQGRRLAGPEPVEGDTLALALSPDGSLMAVSTVEEVRILDPRTLELIHALDISWSAVLRFSPDGSTLIVGSATTPTRVYQTSSWIHREIETHALAVAWSPSGTKFVSIDADRGLRLRDAATLEALQTVPLQRIQLRRGGVARWGFVEFADEEHVVIVDDAAIYTVGFDHDELVEVARSRITHDLTPEECTRYSLPCLSRGTSRD